MRLCNVKLCGGREDGDAEWCDVRCNERMKRGKKRKEKSGDGGNSFCKSSPNQGKRETYTETHTQRKRERRDDDHHAMPCHTITSHAIASHVWWFIDGVGPVPK